MRTTGKGFDRRLGPPPRMVRPWEHDTYASSCKPADSVVCAECSAVQHAGQWYWGAPPVGDVRVDLCPACARIRDRYPAGTLRLRGALLAHEDEVRNLIAGVDEVEKREHPLERVMSVELEDDRTLVVHTTGVHVARRIASKLQRRFHAKARITYPTDQKRMLVDLEA